MNEFKFEINNGITLIALVITIIVLLILAGVTITALGGENGIIKNAIEAKKNSVIGDIKDGVRIEISDKQTDKKDAELTSDELEKILRKYGNLKGEGNILDKILEIDNEYEIPVREIWSGPLAKEPLNLKIGDYVRYDVTYTDVYTGYSFTAENGWRVLDPGTDNGDGTVTGLNLISTGIPAKLNYNFSNIKNKEYNEVLGNWAGNASQRNEYASKFYSSYNNDNSNNNMYAAAGLYYNFSKIKFDQGTNAGENEGCYIEVNGKNTGNLSETEFLTGGAEEVHNLTLAEINKARGENDLKSTSSLDINSGAKGLFYLTGLEDYGYTNVIIPYYFLASPNSSDPGSLRYVNDNGIFATLLNNTAGVRIVLSLPSNFQIEKVGD